MTALAVRDAAGSEGRPAVGTRYWMDLLAAVVMAATTVATAYSAYQSSLWNGEQTSRKFRSTTALFRFGKLSNVALQKTSIHANLFVQWIVALKKGERKTADFLFIRFPEPLKTATAAWQSTKPFESPMAPASAFDMPQYVLPEALEADRWERLARDESVAAEMAGAMANRYLLFTIIYASVLFFAGISGKFGWPTIDLSVLVLATITLVGGLVAMIALPRL